MSTIRDDEFGEIAIRRSSLAHSIRLSVAPNGTLRISMPTVAPLFMAKRLIASSRNDIRKILESERSMKYLDGMQIGKSHSIQCHVANTLRAKCINQVISVGVPPDMSIPQSEVQSVIRSEVVKTLRKEAKHYLPRRLKFLAEKHSLSYEKVRFSHASSRWGSCSSSGTISLNIALMNLPFELIDYVLLHELAHTVQMNHSDKFWSLVETMDPGFHPHRKALKEASPNL